jgi:creatinase
VAKQLQDSWENKMKKPKPHFSAVEMQRREDMMRGWMAKNNVDACLLTSRENINYLASYYYRDQQIVHALVLTQRTAAIVNSAQTSIFIALQDHMKDVKRIAIEFDHVTLHFRSQIMDAYPGVDFVDASAHLTRLRSIKSDEEIRLLTKLANIAIIGAIAARKAIKIGAAEYIVMQQALTAMQTEIIKTWPQADVSDTTARLQSNSAEKIENGDILSLTCAPMFAGYKVSLRRTLSVGNVGKDHLRLWEINTRAHNIAKAVLLPGVKVADVNKSIAEIYAQYDLQNFAQRAVSLVDDTVLQPGMVMKLGPRLTIPVGQKGAGNYGEEDLMLITEKGNRCLTDFPFGPEGGKKSKAKS